VIVLLDVRSIAVKTAVTCFFVMSLIGWASGLVPFVCCKRALIGAVLVYVGASWAVKAINVILVNAIAADQMGRQDESMDMRQAASGDNDLGDTD
jgi:hypothetical protein